jgi:SHS2 domain-containing protein
LLEFDDRGRGRAFDRRQDIPAMPHNVLPHTADTGLEATASSLAALIAELAAGMFGLIAEVRPDRVHRWVDIAVQSATPEDLAVDVLSTLLWHSEVDDIHFSSFEVRQGPDPLEVTVRAGGAPASEAEATGPPIKAITYHGLVVEKREGGWYGRVYFDV